MRASSGAAGAGHGQDHAEFHGAGFQAVVGLLGGFQGEGFDAGAHAGEDAEGERSFVFVGRACDRAEHAGGVEGVKPLCLRSLSVAAAAFSRHVVDVARGG